MAMKINVNGETKQISTGSTISELIAYMDLADKRVAVEVNQQIVPRSQYSDHKVSAGDRVEIVTAIGGG